MEKSPSPSQPLPAIKREDPLRNLKGEDLEYYRNIEYLKKVTRQATALLDRSNAKYENILDDQKSGYRVRARSSDSTKSMSPDMEGKCRKCGLAHGAANFCIVEQIMANEKHIEEAKQHKPKISKLSWRDVSSIDSKSLNNQADSTIEETSTKKEHGKHTWEKINVLEKMTPRQILETYETLCARYGHDAGRHFLLANSMAHPLEGKIEQWMTPPERYPKRIPGLMKRPIPHYEDIREHCLEEKQDYKPLCSGISQEVRQKMETLVLLIPPCDAKPLGNHGKNWRAVFRKHPLKNDSALKRSDWESDRIEFDSSFADESCNCKYQQCVCGIEKICTAPKIEKQCTITSYEDDYHNNHLLMMREKLWKQRETKRQETLMFSKSSMAVVIKTRTRSKEFLEKVKEEQYKTLKNCLSMHLKDEGYDRQEFDKIVQDAADTTAPSAAINPLQWDRWQDQLKEQEKIEDSDEVDSLPSDIETDGESNSLISHSTGVVHGRIKPSRIPYAEDVNNLIDNLYDKITRKFEKSLVKNSFKIRRLAYQPTYAFQHRRLTLLSHQSPLFQEIMYLAGLSSCLKRLKPFKVTKSRKLKRLEVLERRLVRTRRRRNMTRGLQLGKQYRKISQSSKYGPESGYRGFKSQEQKVLDPNVPDRFAKFCLVQVPPGKEITKQRIHHDFMLMRNMFNDAAKACREDLMDQGMLQRLYEFQRKLYNLKMLPYPPPTESDTENEEAHSDHSQFDNHANFLISGKEDTHLLQKANGKPESGYRHLPKQMSYENFPHREEKLRRAKRLKAGQSNSAEKFKNREQSSHTGERHKLWNGHVIPQKCTSSTNVKGEKSKHKEKTDLDKVETHSTQNLLQMRSSVRSLTNLLPPLKGHNAQSLANNEFEETISALQNELSILLNEPGHGSTATAQIKTDQTNNTKSIPKRRHSTATKFPELKTPSRKTCSKTGMSKIRNGSLAHIKQRESVENLKPGRSREEIRQRGLTKKVSLYSIQSCKTKSLVSGKLPLLMDKTKIGSNSSNQSLSKNIKKSASKRPELKSPTIPKQSSFKAWR